MRILLLGGNGQVGWELRRSLAPLGELVVAGREQADFSRPQELERVVAGVAPDVIVNAVAHTAVDRAESEADLARAVNADAPAVLAGAARRRGAWLVHYSTDYVFDGSGARPWREDDATGPLSVYGRTKLDGEIAIREACPTHLILRTSWVYAARGGNFARTMLRLAGERDRLTVIDDQVGAPTGADLIADVSAHAIRMLTDRAELAGLYHLAAAGETSWNGYARFVLEQGLRHGWSLKATPDRVDPVPSSAFQTAARRPANSRLDTRRLCETFGLRMPSWQDGVSRMLTEITP